MSGGYVRDVRDIEREIARIKEPVEQAIPKSSGSGIGFAPVATSPTETWEDPTPPLLMIATDLFATDIPSLVQWASREFTRPLDMSRPLRRITVISGPNPTTGGPDRSPVLCSCCTIRWRTASALSRRCMRSAVSR